MGQMLWLRMNWKKPEKVKIKGKFLNNIMSNFFYSFPAHSVSIIEMKLINGKKKKQRVLGEQGQFSLFWKKIKIGWDVEEKEGELNDLARSCGLNVVGDKNC